MRVLRVFARPCGLHGAVVEDVDLQEDGVVVVHARPRAGERGRCGRCGRRSPGYDRGEGRRRWRALDPGTIRAYLEAEAPRVRCARHGVVVARVPWARHGAWHTRDFEDQAAWLATQAPKSAITRLLRVSWRGVGGDHHAGGGRPQGAGGRSLGWPSPDRHRRDLVSPRPARHHGRRLPRQRATPTASRTPAWRPPAPRSAITRRAFGFHSARALIALAMLTLGGLCPPLPGRALT